MQGQPLEGTGLRDNGAPVVFDFAAPSLCIDDATRFVLQSGNSSDKAFAESELRRALRDAAVELCLDAVADDEMPNNPIVSNSCLSFASNLLFPNFFEDGLCTDTAGPGFDRACEPHGFFDQTEAPGDSAGGGDPFDPEPDLPAKIVHCKCDVASVDGCGGANLGPNEQSIGTHQYCLPDGAVASSFCRENVASYLETTIRMGTKFSGVILDGDETCDVGGGPANVVVNCEPSVINGRGVAEDGPYAFVEENEICAPGCSNLPCEHEVNCDIHGSSTCGSPSEPCAYSCDCDLLRESCFDNPALAPFGICLPELQPDGRLRSATDVLSSNWVAASFLQCGFVSSDFPVAAPPPDPFSTVSPFLAANGTTFTQGLHATCAKPGTTSLGITTFGDTLEDLCRDVPLCRTAAGLDVTITAFFGGAAVAQGTIDNDGTIIKTTETQFALPAGDHIVDLCLTDNPTGIEACSKQPMRVSPALGSGVDAFGHLGGELAGDFVTLNGRPDAAKLSFNGDVATTVRLPSGFAFLFYGTKLSEIFVGANGGIRMTPGTISGTNTKLPASSKAPDIAPFWDDLDPGAAGSVLTFFDGTRFIISWEGVRHAQTSWGDVSFQVHLWADGRIEFHYDDTKTGSPTYDNGASATIGIQQGGGDSVSVSTDDSKLLAGGLAGLGIDTTGCIAAPLRLPPELACTAPDLFASTCVAKGGTVAIPLPDTAACATAATAAVGRIVRSGPTEGSVVDLAKPIDIVGGQAILDVGVHVIEWTATDAAGLLVSQPFFQTAFVGQWATASNCRSATQSLVTLTAAPDVFAASAGPACILAGHGGDAVDGADGDDTILAGVGGDVVDGGDGADLLVCEAGDDIADGGDGPDSLFGDQGNDILDGRTGDDLLWGGAGADIVDGGHGGDTLWGGPGDDVLEGGDGDDELYPGSGVDVAAGGDGDDALFVLDACEVEAGKILDGGDGNDTVFVPADTSEEDLIAAGVVLIGIEQVVALPLPRDAESDCI